MAKFFSSQRRGISTLFFCIACGHTFRRSLERIYIDGPTLDRRKASGEKAEGRSEIIIPQHIICPKCQAVDQYELTASALFAISMALVAVRLLGREAREHPLKIIAFSLADGQIVHPLDALDLCRAQAQASPRDELARMRYANVLRTLGHYPEAHAEYNLLLERNPALLEAWYNLAAIAVAANHMREAKKALTRLLEQAGAGRALSRAEAGWAQNASNYLEEVWPLAELTPRAIFEALPPGRSARPRSWMDLP
jgi:tetratricopeptide (TPR) repeat protein